MRSVVVVDEVLAMVNACYVGRVRYGGLGVTSVLKAQYTLFFVSCV